MPDYSIPTELFGRLKGRLLPLGRKREAERFGAALQACRAALEGLDMATVLDDEVRALIGVVDEAIDVQGISAQPGRSAWVLKAERLSPAARRAFAEAVDALADWFARQPRPADLPTLAASIALGAVGAIVEGIAWDLIDGQS